MWPILIPMLFFLDIYIPGVNGVEVAKQVMATGSKAFIVFVTVESKYAAEAFELGTVDYLLKPFDRSRIRKTMMRIRERLAAQVSLINQRKSKNNTHKKSKLFFRSGGEILAINVWDIIFVEKTRKSERLFILLEASIRSIIVYRKYSKDYPVFLISSGAINLI